MNALTDIQIIRQPDGLPAFAVIPWMDYISSDLAKKTPQTEHRVPNAVVGHMVKDGLGVIAAWRKYLGLSQAQVAARIGISQSAYAQQEAAVRPRKTTREKIARALGIAPILLDVE